jgi:hypothetical protein
MADPGVTSDVSAESALKPPRWRRTVALLRERDWVGIVIEVLVVTLGVLLAFQIDQRAQDRRRAGDERQFLERMWNETAEAMEEAEWLMTLHARFRREFVEGYRALGSPLLLARLSAVQNIGCRAAIMPTSGFNNTSFQELSASGRLNIISDGQLRSELRDVVAAQATAEAIRENSAVQGLEAQRALEPYYVLGMDASDERTCRANWSALARDPQARNAVVRAARLHGIMWTRRAWVRDKLAIAHNGIACALGKADCRARVPQIFRSAPRYDNIPPEARDDFERSANLYSGT